MNLKVFWEDKKGYVEVFEDVIKINIITVEPRKKAVEVVMFDKNSEIILFNEITLIYLIDVDSGREFFRMYS